MQGEYVVDMDTACLIGLIAMLRSNHRFEEVGVSCNVRTKMHTRLCDIRSFVNEV